MEKLSGRLGASSDPVADGTDDEQDHNQDAVIAQARSAWAWNKDILQGAVVVPDSECLCVADGKAYSAYLEQLWYMPLAPELDLNVLGKSEEETDLCLNGFVGLVEKKSFHFYWGAEFRCGLIAVYGRMGFLPMAMHEEDWMVPLFKLHRQRCVIDLKLLSEYYQTAPAGVKENSPSALFFRAAKANRGRKSDCLRISFNEAFEKVVDGVNRQHGRSSWFVQPLVEAYKKLNVVLNPHSCFQENFGVEVHSVEVWEGEELVAGELGYTVGASYTSLSGFHFKKGSGIIQMIVLGELLRRKGFIVWDLGMMMKYKVDMGGQKLNREQFLRLFKTARQTSDVFLTEKTESFNCGEIIKDIRKGHAAPIRNEMKEAAS